jgi:DNA-binding Lrp family transcriptional regulator
VIRSNGKIKRQDQTARSNGKIKRQSSNGTVETIPRNWRDTLTMSSEGKLDRIDLRILSQLQKKGRITNVELADAVGLSPSPCLIRVKRLEKAGYIVGYGAQIQLEKLGDIQIVFTEVTLADHRREDFIKFVAAIKDVDEIVECHLASGGYDYLLKFVTRSVSHYQSIIEGLLERDIGIEKYFSFIIIKSAFVKNHYPLESLFSQNHS